MLRRFAIFMFLCLALGPSVLAGGPDDSLLFFLGREVVVTATRLPLAAAGAPSAVERYDRAEMNALPATTLADVLESTPGAQLRSYGNGLRMLSFRGLGPEYTVVYYNGVRLNDAQNGTVDLGRLPLLGLDRLEVAAGGYGALYGSDALGGVVNISSGSAAAPRVSLRAGGGSFGWTAASLSGRTDIGPLRLALAGSAEHARNNFPFTSAHEPAGEFTRANADYTRRLLTADADYVAPSARLSLHARVSDNDAGAPGAFLTTTPAQARQRDLDASVTLQAAFEMSQETVIRFAPGFTRNSQHYVDPAVQFGGRAIDSKYENTATSLSASVQHESGPSLRFLAGFDLVAAQLRSLDVRGVPSRSAAGAFASAEVLLPSLPSLRLFPSLRYDVLADSPGPRRLSVWSPGLGANLALDGERLFLRARYSRGFRAPTFNQRYWLQGGNPDLRPEFSAAYDAGLGASVLDRVLHVEASYFLHDITDKIVWMPGAGVFWSPKNIQHVLSRGFELRMHGMVPGGLFRYRAHAQILSTKKMNRSFIGDATEGRELPYTPAYSGGAAFEGAFGGLGLAVTLHVVGPRYTLETNAPESRLESTATLDAAASYAFTLSPARLIVKTEVLNLLDAQYQLVAFYPMPPRAFRLTLSLDIP
ncbi:MAG: TonB-dependent receptor [Ignavibacteriae bacterium]|nr:TonB-dependent receptor [Ignavibacteriota bacterium]